MGQTTAGLTEVVKQPTELMAPVGTENWKANSSTKTVWFTTNS
jgi:hypothetical protein